MTCNLTTQSRFDRTHMFDDHPLGSITHYNGILFGGLVARQADCEGALAVSGDTLFGKKGYGYDIGSAADSHDTTYIGKYENPHDLPSLLLDGRVSDESTSVNVESGRLTMSIQYKEYYQQQTFRFSHIGDIDYIDTDLIKNYFQDVKKCVTATSNLLMNCHSEKISLADFCLNNQINDLTIHQNTVMQTEARILAFNIDCEKTDTVNIGEILFSNAIDAYDLILINIPAANVEFSGGAMIYQNQIIDTSCPRAYECNKLLRNLAGKIIYNILAADKITINNYGLIGSVIAPDANVVTCGGSINGMLIANHLLQDEGFELHAFGLALGDRLWEIEPRVLSMGIEVIKLDADDHRQTLADAEFSLYMKNGETGEYMLFGEGYKTGQDGQLTITDLLPGQYKLLETKAPPGYQLPAERTYEFQLEQNEEGNIDHMETIYIYNTLLKGNILFIKTDEEDHTLMLGGAIFELHKESPTPGVYESYRTDLTTQSDGRLLIEELEPGNYKLIEIQSPIGYYRPAQHETHFSIRLDEAGQIIDMDPIYIMNSKLGSIRIVKLDSNDKELTLAGAVFDLYRWSEEQNAYMPKITGLTTAADGSILIEDLEPGKYKLIETKPPRGYRIDDAETFFTIEL